MTAEDEKRAKKNARNRRWREAHKHEPKYKAMLRRYKVKAQYGIEDEGLLPDHCEICGSTVNLHIDHNHKTNKVRGRLCLNCNHGLGKFKDNKVLLRKAMKYLAEKE